MGWVDEFRGWGKRAMPAAGPLEDGSPEAALKVDNVVFLAIDSNGRVFQIEDATIVNGLWVGVVNGRSAVCELLDTFDVQDGVLAP